MYELSVALHLYLEGIYELSTECVVIYVLYFRLAIWDGQSVHNENIISK